MKIAVFLLLGVIVSMSSCRSPGSSSSDASLPCICGTPEADFEGCPCAVCIKGERNPNNPDCVCGPMKLGGKQ